MIHAKEMRNMTTYFVLVFLLSIPFYVLGALTKGSIDILPLKLPLSALMTFCPAIAATVLVFGEYGISGVKELWRRTFDFKKIKDLWWLLPILLIMPAIALISYYWTKNTIENNSSIEFSVLMILFSFTAFFVAAIGEELGWSGYSTEPMQERFGAFIASIIIGTIWSVWHLVPFL